MTDTKTIHDMLIQIEGGDNDMEVINQAADRLLYLEDACRVKDLKFDRLCKDMDAMAEYVEELKRVIANQRSEFDHAHGESAHMLKRSQDTAEKLRLAWTTDLKDAINAAKAVHTSVKGMTLFSSKN